MFTYEHIQKFNVTEIGVYKYIVSNAEKVPFMTTRELPEALHISISTVLRFCEKVGCNGYNEFKEQMKVYLKTADLKPPMEDLQAIVTIHSRLNPRIFGMFYGKNTSFMTPFCMIFCKMCAF